MPYYLPLLFFYLIAVPAVAVAQQCTTPAEPVAIIDFGSAAAPFSTTGKLGTGYQTSTEDCIPERSIGLRKRAFLCNPEWHVLTADHTLHDEGGNFLMVNGAEGTSDIFRDTVSGLCPGTTFFVEAWVINLMRKPACSGTVSEPDLAFVLTDMAGNKLAEAASGKIPQADGIKWVPVSFQFVCPDNGTVVINVTNRNGTSCGSDFGLDDISFSPCNKPFLTSIQGVGNNEVKVCQDDQKPYLLQAQSGAFNNPTVQWQAKANGGGWQDIPGATSLTYLRQPTEWGNYEYRQKLVENGNKGCQFTSDVTQIIIYPQPFAQGVNYVFGCYGFPFKLQGAGGSQYEWSGPSGFFSTNQAPVVPKLEFSHAGMYRVKVTTTEGCIGYDSTNLVVHDAPVGNINLQDTTLCTGDSVQLKASGSVRYLWQPADGLSSDTVANPIAKPKKTTSYTVYIFQERTCYDTANVTIQVLERPTAFAGPDQFALKNRPVQLEGKVSGDGAMTFKWTPEEKLNNPRLLRPQTKLTETTVFRLAATAGNGCGTVSDEVKIEVVDGLHIPTAFTPNNDFLNDAWEIAGIEEYPAATVRVFNRWGEEVYSSTGGKYKPWNGKHKSGEATPGIYSYLLNLGDGSAVRKGTITLLK